MQQILFYQLQSKWSNINENQFLRKLKKFSFREEPKFFVEE